MRSRAPITTVFNWIQNISTVYLVVYYSVVKSMLALPRYYYYYSVYL